MPRKTQVQHSSRALLVLTTTVVSAAVLAALYWGRALLIPFALAVYLAFLLNPLVRTFQRWGLRRTPSVLAVSLLASVVLFAVGWVVAGQVSRFVNRIPDYAEALDHKVQSWKSDSQHRGKPGSWRTSHRLSHSSYSPPW